MIAVAVAAAVASPPLARAVAWSLPADLRPARCREEILDGCHRISWGWRGRIFEGTLWRRPLAEDRPAEIGRLEIARAPDGPRLRSVLRALYDAHGVVPLDGAWVVSWSYLHGRWRGRGFGRKLYEGALVEVARRGGVLVSGNVVAGEDTSIDAARLWRRLLGCHEGVTVPVPEIGPDEHLFAVRPSRGPS